SLVSSSFITEAVREKKEGVVYEENESAGFEKNESVGFEENEEEAMFEEHEKATFEENGTIYLGKMKSGQKEGIPFEKWQIKQYNNSLNHMHILEKSDVLKHLDAVQKLIEEEAVKNYILPTIVSAIKDYATKELNLDASVKELKQKEVSTLSKMFVMCKKIIGLGNINIESDIAKY
ncbi:33775_t:CDS:2, partial [Gigaspora margarita]